MVGDGVVVGTFARGIHSWCEAYSCVVPPIKIVAACAAHAMLLSMMSCERWRFKYPQI